MCYLILFIYCIAAILVFWEDKLSKNSNRGALCVIGLALIAIAGLKEIGADPDSLNYASAYRICFLGHGDEKLEYSFLLLSEVFNNFTRDPHIIFFFYATVGLFLKFYTFKTLSNSYFLPLIIFLSFYFEVHEMMQIRTAILSGAFLCAIKPIAEGKRLKALLILAFGTLFHYSGLLLWPLVLLSNKPLNNFWKMAWLGIIPLGYMIFFAGGSILFNESIPFIGPKLAAYQKASDMGLLHININVFAPLLLLSTTIYVYLMFFADEITEKNKYFPLLMKIYGLGLFSYVSLAFLPVVAERVSFLLRTPTIILYTCIFYTIKPAWFSKTVLILLGVLFLNYGLSYLYFVLIWKV